MTHTYTRKRNRDTWHSARIAPIGPNQITNPANENPSQATCAIKVVSQRRVRCVIWCVAHTSRQISLALDKKLTESRVFLT